MLEHGALFFLVLPDREDSRAVLRHPGLRGHDIRVVEHASGLPWIVGRWDDGDLRLARRGPDSLAVVGRVSANDTELLAALASWDRRTGADEPSRRWAGDFHVVSSVGGEASLRGTAYGTRRVFHTDHAGLTVASDRAAALARLTGAPIDRSALATRLISPSPYPLAERPLWNGVHSVRPGYRLVLPGAGGARSVRWHRPPEPGVGLRDGARQVREALDRAVALRTDGDGLVSSDLSGGLDSTSVAFVAARQLDPSRFLVSTGSDNPGNCDDLNWARDAVAHLPGVEHDVFAGAEQPLFYEGWQDLRVPFDVPSEAMVNPDRVFASARRMARRGSRLHFKGIGGDQLFQSPPAHYHALLTRQPLLSLQRIRGYRALFSWRWRELLPALADRRSFATAMSRLDLANPRSVEFGTVLLDWSYPARVPSWLTAESRDLLAEELASTSGAAPLAPTRGRHLELEAIDCFTRELAPWRDIGRRDGIEFALPYFDDHVIDAALAVRPRDRATPFAYKPLLAEAMRGVLPAEITRRRTKATGDAAVGAGLRRGREALAALWEDSVLGDLGLADPGELRRLCLSPSAKGAAEGLIDAVAAELWARSAVPAAAAPDLERSASA
ncbi:asparagine synthase [Prauserella cavernicola]|uniref:Asparagine synthase n=1 Tax=Prauserella cavernicola TaxID=2800127 RepID=A0A934V453_9PSEU|nr:asparagine synthase [Prauserella cavernicola]MBK1783760.1 asparagine synthase [Prauserella cavernicola]